MSSSQSTFNEENFNKKLDNLQATQDSIQTLSLWIIHHKSNHDLITKLWFNKLKQVKNAKHQLSLFYLANDVIQNCKRKNAKIYQESFKQYLIGAVKLIRKETSIKKNIERTFNVWLERNVYDGDFIKKLIKLLNNNNNNSNNDSNDENNNNNNDNDKDDVKSDTKCSNSLLITNDNNEYIITNDTNVNNNNKEEIELQQIITEFQPKKLCEMINKYNLLEKDNLIKKSSVEATRLLEINIDYIKQYRDKAQCIKFGYEFENSCLKLDDYIKNIETQVKERENLINLLEQSEIFYDAQYKDAKIVFNAYRSFALKVHTLQKKLEEMIDKFSLSNDAKLDNLDMEMSDNDENEENNNKTINKGLPIPSIISSISTKSVLNTNNSGGIRNNLDPRQNRHQLAHSSSLSSLPYTQGSPLITNKNEDYASSSTTPLRDELADQHSSKSPLDFLTKFISKSSSSSSNTNSNSNILSSLQKYVCNNTGASSNTLNNNNNNINSNINNNNKKLTTQINEHNLYDPRDYTYNGYYDDNNMIQTTSSTIPTTPTSATIPFNMDNLINFNDTSSSSLSAAAGYKKQRTNSVSSTSSSNILINTQNRSCATPTKDEIYQNSITASTTNNIDLLNPYAHYGQLMTNSAIPPPPPPPPQILPSHVDPHAHVMNAYNYMGQPPPPPPPPTGVTNFTYPPPPPPPNIYDINNQYYAYQQANPNQITTQTQPNPYNNDSTNLDYYYGNNENGLKRKYSSNNRYNNNSSNNANKNTNNNNINNSHHHHQHQYHNHYNNNNNNNNTNNTSNTIPTTGITNNNRNNYTKQSSQNSYEKNMNQSKSYRIPTINSQRDRLNHSFDSSINNSTNNNNNRYQ